MIPQISIIIPVHNAEPFLACCLDSAAAQTEPELEIICVDDASTDASPAMLDARAREDKRFRVVHRETNGGESVARNQGVALARGEYLAFLDHDDMLEPDACRVLYQAAKKSNADIAKGRARTVDFDGTVTITPMQKQKLIVGNSNLHLLAEWWTAIYKSKMIHGNIYFADGYPLGADRLFLLDALLASSKIICVDNIVYKHILRENSGYSKQLTYEKIRSDLSICMMALERLNNSNIYIKNQDSYAIAAQRFLYNGIVHFFKCLDEKSKKLCCDFTFSYIQKLHNRNVVLKNLYLDFPPITSVIEHGNSDDLYEFLKHASSVDDIRSKEPDRISKLRDSVRLALKQKGTKA